MEDGLGGAGNTKGVAQLLQRHVGLFPDQFRKPFSVPGGQFGLRPREKVPRSNVARATTL